MPRMPKGAVAAAIATIERAEAPWLAAEVRGPDQIHSKVCAIRADLNRVLLERTSAVDNALLALLTGQHLLLLGPPGTGKSMLVRALSLRLTDCVYFEKLLSQFTVPEELYGPIDLIRYADQGIYQRISTGALSSAHIGFLDECWKANSAILNTLLSIMNERLLHEVGFPPQRVPLLSLFGASNETPQDSSLKALDDRFLLREIVEYISEERSFKVLLTQRLDMTDVQASLSLEELRQAQEAVHTVTGPQEVLQAILTLRQQLSQEGVVVSDRKWKKCMLLLKARAWLDGMPGVDIEHLTCLAHVLWTDPKERKAVERIIYELASPLALRAIEIEDAATDTYRHLPREDNIDYLAAAETTLQALKDAAALLRTVMVQSKARNTQRAQEAMGRIQSMHNAIAERIKQRMGGFTL